MNRWTLLLILIVLAAVGMLNRDKISAYLGNKSAPVDVSEPVLAVATPNPAKESVEAARKRYPQLGVPNSQFNLHFVQLYNAAKTSDPALLAQSDWPMQLADRTAHDLNIVTMTTPSLTEVSRSVLDARPPSQAVATVAPSVQLPGLKGSSLDQRPASSHH